MLGRVVIALVVLFLVVSIVGMIIDALRWLLGVAVIAGLAALAVGALGRTPSR